MTRDWTEEEIAAHVDGALEPRDEARVRRAIETDPEARAVAERVRALNGLLAAAYPLPGPEVPDGIAAVLGRGAGAVVPFRGRPRPQWPQLAAAAAVALAIGIGAGVMWAGGAAGRRTPVRCWPMPARRSRRRSRRFRAGRCPTPGCGRSRLSATRKGAPAASSRRPDSPPARSGIACRQPQGGWDLVAIVALPDSEQEGDGFAPASGPEDQLIDMALEALGAGVPLSPDEEAGLLRSNWRQP